MECTNQEKKYMLFRNIPILGIITELTCYAILFAFLIMSLWYQAHSGAFYFLLSSFFSQFDKWTDSQRRRILTGLLERCSLSQQKFCCRKLQEKLPAEALDFTTKLPRVLSLYIFSFLDPRSLCRCAQVKTQKQYKALLRTAQKTVPLKLEGKEITCSRSSIMSFYLT